MYSVAPVNPGPASFWDLQPAAVGMATPVNTRGLDDHVLGVLRGRGPDGEHEVGLATYDLLGFPGDPQENADLAPQAGLLHVEVDDGPADVDVLALHEAVLLELLHESRERGLERPDVRHLEDLDAVGPVEGEQVGGDSTENDDHQTHEGCLSFSHVNLP